MLTKFGSGATVPSEKTEGAPKNHVRIALSSNLGALTHFSLSLEITSFGFEMVKGNNWGLVGESFPVNAQ